MRTKKPGRYLINAALAQLRDAGNVACTAPDAVLNEPGTARSPLRATPGILFLHGL